jgi:M6 family metalloprotease-like protein
MFRTLGFALTTLLLATSATVLPDADIPESGILTLSNSTPSTYQRTLSTFSGSTTALTPQQKAQVKAAVEANPSAEKFICTGIRYYSQPTNINIMVRKRAKAACDYAKELNPNLSTWFQNKPTQARSYAGKVLLTLKMPPATDTNQEQTTLPLERGISQSSPVEKCKITSTGSGWNTVGFPINLRFGGRETYQTLPNRGTIRALVIGVDFPNYRGLEMPADYVAEVTKKNNDFFNEMSYGAVRFEYTVLPSYVRMSRNAEEYGIGTWGSGDYVAYYREALANAARLFDIGGYDVAYVMASPQTPASAITPGPAFPAPEKTEDGVVPLGTATGGMPLSEPAFRWMAHETGHLFGWVDLYDVSGKDDPANGRNSRFGWWDIMSMNWETFNLELNGWFRFQVGWIPDADILCFEARNLSEAGALIQNLSSSQGQRLIVIRTGEQKAIVIERRSITKYAPMFNNPDWAGVLVYEVDGAKDFQMAPMSILRKKGLITDSSLPNAALQPNEFVTSGGIVVKVTGQSETVSFVELSNK